MTRHKTLLAALVASLLFALAGPGPALAAERGGMAATANPHATRAALAILRAGGSALDAAIAAEMVLGLVEPQSSGIGGGAFLLYYDQASRAVSAYDGRETAPAAATPELFLGPDGEPLGFFEALVGGRAVGVPGLLRMLELAHRRHGALPWADLFQPAIRLARAGFRVSPRLHYLIGRDKYLKDQPAARAYFLLPDGRPKPVGQVLTNPEYAATLTRIAAAGADAFYQGPIARDIVATVTGHAANPGLLSLADLAGYQAKRRFPLCRPYRRFRVCGMPPPTSGGATVLEILGLLEPFAISRLAPGSASAVHLIAEASRLAFADRNRYLADSDFVAVPIRGLLDRSYLKARARRIDPDRAGARAAPGLPAERRGGLITGRSPERPSTTHLTIADGAGNVVSMTASVEYAFGSHLMVRGFLLNNQLTDFSFRPKDATGLVANRVEPGKRPRSSMAPTIVLDRDGGFRLGLGSPGGSRIIGYVAATLIAVLDWSQDIQTAIAAPHFVNRNGPTDLEQGTALEALAPELEALGHEVRIRPLNSGLHGIERTPAGWRGGADPRREGTVGGD